MGAWLTTLEVLAVPIRDWLESKRERTQHLARCAQGFRAEVSEGRAHGRLHRAIRLDVERPTFGGGADERTAPVKGIGPSSNELLPLEPLQDSGQGARVQVQNLGQAPRRDPGETAYYSQHEPLRSREADRRHHALGGSFERVIHGPDETHEIEHFPERRQGICFNRASNSPSHRALLRCEGRGSGRILPRRPDA
jgi:hypothetical protein